MAAEVETYDRRTSKLIWDRTNAYTHRMGSLGVIVRALPNWEAAPAKIKPHVPQGTPAWSDLDTNTIYLDLEALTNGSKGLTIDALIDSEELLGVMFHEVAHIEDSRWAKGAKLDRPAVADAMMTMEEVRIETRVVDYGGTDHVNALRAMFTWLLRKILAEDNMPETPLGVAKMWALTCGRVKAGVAVQGEVINIDTTVRTILGDDVVDAMSDILDEATLVDRLSRREALAKEWVELFPSEEPEEAPCSLGACASALADAMSDDSGEGGGKDKGEGEEEGEGESSGKEDGEVGSEGETASQGKTSKHDSSDATGMLRRAVLKDAEVVDDGVAWEMGQFPQTSFADAMKRAHLPQDSARLWRISDPSTEQRAVARRLARTLTSLSLPSITRVGVASELPPGRLRGREMVRRAAERDRGMMTTATPWEASKRLRSHTKPVIVGCMTDVSGSMHWAQEFVGEFAYVVATAGLAVGARTAAVTFGSRVDLVTRPGDRPTKIYTRTGLDGHEKFNDAAGLIDGLLHFRTNRNAAKVLFVVSDGVFVNHPEPQIARKWVRDWTVAGTTIVWVTADSRRSPHLSSYMAEVKKPGSITVIHTPMHVDERGFDAPNKDELYNLLNRQITQAARTAA